jgi:DNA polymerase I
MRKAMSEASMFVLGGFELATDVKVVRWPDRYVDPRGQEMWNRVCNLVAAEERPQQQWGQRA